MRLIEAEFTLTFIRPTKSVKWNVCCLGSAALSVEISPDGVFVVVEDPDGNLFYVVQRT